MLILLLRQCNSNETLRTEIKQVQSKSDRNLNNYKASLDTIITERNNNNELVSIISSYVYDINTLTLDNEKTIARYTESLDIVDDIHNINSILTAEILLRDSIINANTNIVSVDDSSLIINFSDDKKWDKYNWRMFNGTVGITHESVLNKMVVNSSQFNFEQGIEINAAILDINGVKTLKITTAYPGVKFTNIKNINLVNDKLNEEYNKKAGWSIGIGIGYGINLNNNKVVSMGPSINAGIMWSPKWLRF